MEQMNPLVSVVITTYKRSNFLKRAIKSVLEQTYQNIELIIIDDNNFEDEYSKKVQKIVNNIKKYDKRICYIPMMHNSGACKARNRGLHNAHGKYINFLDDDDVFLKNKLQYQVNKFCTCSNNIAAVGCYAEIRNEQDEIIQYSRYKIRGNVFYENLCCSVCSTSLALIKREYLIKSGGFEEIVSSQEHLMFAKLFNVCPYYDVVERELVIVYHHSGERISNGVNKPKGAIELANRFKRYYPKLNKNQIKRLEMCMNGNIINAFLLVNKRGSAFKYYIYRILKFKCFTKDDIKLVIGVIFGNNLKQKMHKAISKRYK